MALISLTFVDWLVTVAMGVTLGLCATYAYKATHKFRNPYAWKKRR